MSYVGGIAPPDPTPELGATVPVAGVPNSGTFNARLVGADLQSVLDTAHWTSTTSSGTNTYSGGGWRSASGAAAQNYAHLYSVARARLISLSQNIFEGVFRIGEPTGTQHYIWGALNLASWTTAAGSGYLDTDNATFYGGYYFDYNLADGLSINIRNSTVASNVKLKSGAFNGDVKTWTNDGLMHRFQIVYSTIGARFFIDGVFIGSLTSDKYPIPVPTGVTGSDLHATAAAYVPYGGTGSATEYLTTYSASISRVGDTRSPTSWRYITSGAATGILKRGSGNLRRVVAGNNVGSLLLYDDITAVAANAICNIDLTQAANRDTTFNFDLQNGLYYALTGAGEVTVIFE